MKKFREFEIVTVTLFLFVSMIILNSVYAQNTSLTGSDTSLLDSTRTSDTTATVDSTVRTTTSDTTSTSDATTSSTGSDTSTTGDTTNTTLTTTTTRTTTLSDEEVQDSVGTVSETFDEIRTGAAETEDEIKDAVKDGIDKNIVNIRTQTDLPAYELQKAVDDDRLQLFDEISRTLNSINITNTQEIDNLADQVEQRVQNIQGALEGISGLEADFENETRSIRNTLLAFKESIDEKAEIIENREGEKVWQDSDGDGVSDYDEEFIYNTDPQRASTSGDGQTDAEKIASGINPVTGEQIEYQDPRQDVDSYVSRAYRLDNVSLIKEDSGERLRFEGRAMPNSFVTLYIYSTPIVVTVKTNESGDWSYELDKELENGEHQVYVATVNNTGKIVARSNPISFTKTADAASVGIVGVDFETSQAGDFFRDNFILIALGILIAIVVLALMFIGNGKGAREVVQELKEEVEKPTGKK